MNRTVAREYWNRATAIVPTHFSSYPIGGTEKGVSHIMSARESKGSNSMFKAMHKGMRRILLLVVVGVLPFPLTPSAARAAEEKASTGKPQAHVMLVGINDYADKQIKPRKFAGGCQGTLRPVHRQALFGSRGRQYSPASGQRGREASQPARHARQYYQGTPRYGRGREGQGFGPLRLFRRRSAFG